MKIDESIIKSWEEHAFYESGLCSDGCIEKFGDFEYAALEKYGRLLLKYQEEYLKNSIKNESRNNSQKTTINSK
jgi:hypothetical protein